MATTTTKAASKTAAASAPADANDLASWARFGLETLNDIQKQWIHIATGYGDLAFQAAKENLSTLESFYSQTRKSAEEIVENQRERIDATIDRLA